MGTSPLEWRLCGNISPATAQGRSPREPREEAVRALAVQSREAGELGAVTSQGVRQLLHNMVHPSIQGVLQLASLPMRLCHFKSLKPSLFIHVFPRAWEG